MTEFIPYGRQSIDDDDIRAVADVLRSDFITQGPKVEEFENALASYCTAKYAVVLSSGTSALHAAYFAAGLRAGDEIITSPMTFVATANAALYLGAKPVFVDIEPDTGNINVALIEKAITEKTKAVVPVHYAGHPADMDGISDIAQKHGLSVIEDACHALGAGYKGKKIGSISDMTVFSFHPLKHITTGEGGAVLTNDRECYEKLVMFRTHGITKEVSRLENASHGDWYYEMQLLGYNFRMTDIQAALGTSQLNKLEGFVKRRRRIADLYSDSFKGNGWFDVPVARDYAASSWHLYPIRLKDNCVEKKAEIFSKLKEKGLGVQVHYIPVYWQPYYRDAGFEKGMCFASEDFYQREISIPVYPAMTDENVAYVMQIIFEVFKKR